MALGSSSNDYQGEIEKDSKDEDDVLQKSTESPSSIAAS